MHAGALNRIGGAFPATGLDQIGRVQQQFTVDKAFVQFAGVTAGRASSFFDFYAHDFEFIVATMGSDIPSTNLAAYTATMGKGLSATLSVEDPSFRHTPVYSAQNAVPRSVVDSGAQVFGPANPVTPIFVGFDAAGRPTGLGFVDTVQRNRMPDVIGVLRYDQSWGSAQVSGALHEVNHGQMDSFSFTGTNLGAPVTLGNNQAPRGPASALGFAVQGGLKVNLPFIAAGDSLYLQAAYGEGAALYTGLPAYNGPWAQAATAIQGAAFSQFFNDGVINPFTNRLELTSSISFTAAMLHYWTPSVRSALFGSYGAMTFARGAREAQGAFFSFTNTGPGTPGTRFFDLSQVLRDSYRFVVGANLIWSPVKEFDIGSRRSTPATGRRRAASSTSAGFPTRTRPSSTTPPTRWRPPARSMRSRCGRGCSGTSRPRPGRRRRRAPAERAANAVFREASPLSRAFADLSYIASTARSTGDSEDSSGDDRLTSIL